MRFATQRKSLLKRKFGKANSKFVHSSLLDHEYACCYGMNTGKNTKINNYHCSRNALCACITC